MLNGSDYGVYGKMYEPENAFDAARGQFLLPHTTEAENAYLQQAEFCNTDWFKELFSPAIMQNDPVSLSGDTAKSNYYASLSTLLDPGWYKQSDVKCYGITIYRRDFDANDKFVTVTDSMPAGDPRRAIQLPQDVISAGLTPNPRKTLTAK